MKKRLLCFCAVILIMIAFSIMHINALDFIQDSLEKVYLTVENHSDTRVISSSVSYSYADGIFGSDIINPSSWDVAYGSWADGISVYLPDLYSILEDSQVDGAVLNGGTINLSVTFDFGNGYDFSLVSNYATVTRSYFRFFADLDRGASYLPLLNFRIWGNFSGVDSSENWYLLHSISQTETNNFMIVDNSFYLPVDSSPLFRIDFSFSSNIFSNDVFRLFFTSDSFLEIEKGHFIDNSNRYLDEYLDILGNLKKPDPIDFSGFDITNVSFYPLSLSLFTDLHSNSSYIPIFYTVIYFASIFGFYSFIVFGMKR